METLITLHLDVADNLFTQMIVPIIKRGYI